jgi:uncharacterized protein involved in propanediol utilization
MAIPKLKATYSLDAQTMRVLERVAARWGVSKSEALRRAIRASVTLPQASGPAAATLDTLQKLSGLTAGEAAKWAGAVRANRRATRAGKSSRK